MRGPLLLLPLLAAAAAAQVENPPFRLPEGVTVERDLVYTRASGRDLRLDLYLPASGVGPFPAIVYVHGGAWQAGNRNAFRRQAAHMATRGFAGACIEYRLSSVAPYPAALHDSKAAVRWLRAHSAQYRIDPRRIGAAGGSAGGHLVALLGTTGAVKRFEGDGGNPGQSSAVQAVAAFNPALDLVDFGQAAPRERLNPAARFLGCPYAENPALWADATPITHAGKGSAPFLFLHGNADKMVPYAQSVRMMEKLRAAGVPAAIFTAEGAGHAFFHAEPWYGRTLRRMEEFFVGTLR